MTEQTRALVIGATGILSPAAVRLQRRGVEVTGVARRSSAQLAAEAPAIEQLTVDARDADTLGQALGERRFEAALVYAPTVTPESLAVAASRVDGRLVLVNVSAAADPALGEFALQPDVLQLGWSDQGDGGTRWHTPEEVSDAALQVLADGRGRVLGVVRPWERRP